MALEVTHSSLFNGLWAPVTLKADFTKFHFCGFFTYFTYVEYSHISLCCPKWFPNGPIYTLLYSAAFPPELMFWGWNVSDRSLKTLPTLCKLLSQFLPHSCGTPSSDTCNKCFPNQTQLGAMATTLQPSLHGLPYSGVTILCTFIFLFFYFFMPLPTQLHSE